MKIVTTAQMRALEEQAVQAGISMDTLMENAGKAIADGVRSILAGVEGRKVLFLIGPGNNGGDGLVAARLLHDWGARVNVYILAERPAADPKLKLVQERGIKVVEAIDDLGIQARGEMLTGVSALVDAVFGTGLSRRFGGLVTTVLGRVHRAKKEPPFTSIIAVDVPSGLDADTGAVDPSTPYADFTITLGFPKAGMLKSPGSERVGKISVADIGLGSVAAAAVVAEAAAVTKTYINEEYVRATLPQRPKEANKGTFGRVLVVGGSINYPGAACLACSGAARVGAGLVTLATAASLPAALAARMVETTYLPLPEARTGIVSSDAAKVIYPQMRNADVMLIGPGLGQEESTVRFLRLLLFGKNRPKLPALVLDADALNILANVPGWWIRLPSDAVITPHPGEMARLAGMKIEEIQADREGVTKKLAAKWRKTVVLKGAYTVIATPDEQVKLSDAANPGLASAGTGDVLSGIIAGLVAQRLSLLDAAACGVYLHAAAGEAVCARLGDAGMLASDLLPELPLVIKHTKERPTK